jgi:hypothetical protein
MTPVSMGEMSGHVPSVDIPISFEYILEEDAPGAAAASNWLMLRAQFIFWSQGNVY